MWETNLVCMYQQWCQGNDDYLYRYMDFVEMVAKNQHMNVDDVMREMQKYHWFKRPEVC